MPDRSGPRAHMARTRSRMLTFRVTEGELERLRAVADLSGSRCLSDYLRDTVLKTLNRTGKAPAAAFDGGDAALRIVQQLQGFEERVSHLESRLADLLAASPSPSSQL